MPPPAQTPEVTLSEADRQLLQRIAAAAEAIQASLAVIADRWLQTTGG